MRCLSVGLLSTIRLGHSFTMKGYDVAFITGYGQNIVQEIRSDTGGTEMGGGYVKQTRGGSDCIVGWAVKLGSSGEILGT